MKIGLLRHFPVEEALPSGWYTAGELCEWRIRYDASAPRTGPVDVSAHPWQRCLSSDLRRAYVTAQAAYQGDIQQTELLREAEFNAFATGGLKLPVRAWHWVLRLAWMTAHSSQRDVRDDFRRRTLAIADLLEKDGQDTLVVSHAGMMIYLRKELIRRGFTGPKFQLPQNALLYVFERL